MLSYLIINMFDIRAQVRIDEGDDLENFFDECGEKQLLGKRLRLYLLMEGDLDHLKVRGNFSLDVSRKG